MVVQGKLKKAVGQWESAWRDLMTMLSDIPDATACKQPKDGSWSVHQVLQHLCLAESQSLAYLRRKAHDPSGVPKVDMASRLRVLVLELALASPLKFKAPAVAGEAHFPADENWLQTRQRIEDEHRKIITFLEELDPELADKQLFRHPLAGRMPLEGVFRFFRWHVRHHQRQVWRILEQVAL